LNRTCPGDCGGVNTYSINFNCELSNGNWLESGNLSLQSGGILRLNAGSSLRFDSNKEIYLQGGEIIFPTGGGSIFSTVIMYAKKKAYHYLCFYFDSELNCLFGYDKAAERETSDGRII